MSMRKSHKVLVSVTFDRPCTKREALEAMRDTIYGEHYMGMVFDRPKGPESFRIKGMRTAPDAGK